MGGGPSIPAPPPPPPPLPPPPAPDPRETAKATTEAWTNFYNNALNSYISNIPRIAEAETQARIAQQPTQRALERQLSALDQQASIQAALQLERQYGGQRSIELMRRQYELSPSAFALSRGLGQQYERQFAQLYGVSPQASVPATVSQAAGVSPVDYFSTISTKFNPQI
jgi:bisphosphoglycerate-dependent phosphoglycerate mutase